MIPKTIHYCWFGGNPLPPLAVKCIKSWKKHCPDFEIIEWNESNFDIASAPLYVRQAFEAKKWAFVTDYVRLYALTSFGGIYMDTDVEVVKPLNPFLNHAAFSGFESETTIPTGIMACEKGFPLFTELMRYYDGARFLKDDGTFNVVTNVEIITKLLRPKGLNQNNQYQVIDGFALYPNDYFCPLDYLSGKLKKTKRTVTIHWFNGSWKTPEQKKLRKQYRRKTRAREIYRGPARLARKLFGAEPVNRIKRLICRKR